MSAAYALRSFVVPGPPTQSPSAVRLVDEPFGCELRAERPFGCEPVERLRRAREERGKETSLGRDGCMIG